MGASAGASTSAGGGSSGPRRFREGAIPPAASAAATATRAARRMALRSPANELIPGGVALELSATASSSAAPIAAPTCRLMLSGPPASPRSAFATPELAPTVAA